MDTVIHCIGTLSTDIELEFTPAGKPVVNFIVDLERDNWIGCSLFGDKAKSLAERGRKGDRVVVVGYLRQRKGHLEVVAQTVGIEP